MTEPMNGMFEPINGMNRQKRKWNDRASEQND